MRGQESELRQVNDWFGQQKHKVKIAIPGNQDIGLDVLNYTEMDHEDRPDPMHVVFPKMAKCTFHKYGPSGTIEKKDGLCVLPVNIINEKIFIFLWFWLVVVSAITGVFLIYRVAVLAGPQIRIALITVKV